MPVTFVGAGYVGLVSAAVFADLGVKTWLLDIDEKKISTLKKGRSPIFEPGLKDLLGKNSGKTLFPTVSYKKSIPNSEIIFVCVNTLSPTSGKTNFSYVEVAAREVAKNLGVRFTVVVIRSTVWPGISEEVEEIIREVNPKADFAVLFCPEFLREGQAIEDTLHPSRIVIGGGDKKAIRVLKDFFGKTPAPFVVTDFRSAELIKYASNAFLATKISFINEFSQIAGRVGADIKDVALGVGLDPRIGRSFLEAGLGFGGSCLPKDLEALSELSRLYGHRCDILEAVRRVNHQQHQLFVEKVKKALGGLKGKKLTILGLSFKPGTDDLRKAVSLEIIKMVLREGASISVYDPAAMEKAKKILKGVAFAQSPYEALKDSDCLVLVTEWEEFKNLDFKKIKSLMRTPLIADGRNLFDPKVLRKLGFDYLGVGRKVS